MCGIAGFLTLDEATPDKLLLQRMCDRIAHRGPDGSGYFTDESVALGHRRLSIIDVAGGAQPLGNENGSLQVVFNGEIYNYRELRKDLVAKGHQFTTHSDTEVLVHLYEEVGTRLPEYLNGMFAFAIWDRRKRELFLARDRFGKKPLYYSLASSGLFRCAFASELKALTVLPGFDFTVNARSVADFLSLSYVPDPQTIYRNVFKLPPAHSLLISGTSEKLSKYWSLEFTGAAETGTEAVAEELDALLVDSVERRMISDVPLGGFLSGGVDSSATVAFMARKAPDRVKTFSIGFTNKAYDELEFARLVVSRYATDHHEQVVSPQISDVLATLVEHYDEPFADASAIPMLYLSKMTRQHVTVALCGDGADELFGGYRRYFFGVLEERLRARFPSWFRQSVIRGAGRLYPKFDYLPQVFRAKTLLQNVARELGDAYFTSMTVFRDESLDSVLSPDLKRELGGYSTREHYCGRFARFQHLSPLQQLQAVDLETYLPGDILVKADRATMAYSLESRSPLLDYRIGELAGRIPDSMKIRGRVGKYILKKTVAPYVPSPIITRRKMGFAVPLAEWFRTSLKPVFQAAVLDQKSLETYISLPQVGRLWNEHQTGLHNHDRKLWNLLMLACWRERHGRCNESAELTIGANP